jgi:hypothetical protein
MAKQVKLWEMQTNYSHPLLGRDFTPNVWSHNHETNAGDPHHELSNKLWCCKAFKTTAARLWLRMIDSWGQPYVLGGDQWQYMMFINDEQPIIWRHAVFGCTVARTDALIQLFSRVHSTQYHNQYTRNNSAPLIRCHNVSSWYDC